VPNQEVPNHLYGHGRVDALAAVRRAIDLATAVAELPAREQSLVEIFPNPFREKMYLRLPEATDSRVQVEMFNQLGQLVQMSTFPPTGHNFIELEAGHLPPGLYLLRVQVSEKIFSGRSVKW
jgi:hypothetical protein